MEPGRAEVGWYCAIIYECERRSQRRFSKALLRWTHGKIPMSLVCPGS